MESRTLCVLLLLCLILVSTAKKYTVGVILNGSQQELSEQIVSLQIATEFVNSNTSDVFFLFHQDTRRKLKAVEDVELILNITTTAQTDAVASVQAASWMLAQNGYIGLIGPTYSLVSVEVSKQAANVFKKPLLSHASTSTDLSSSEHPYFYRVIPPDDQQVESIIDFCRYFKRFDVIVLYSAESYGKGAYEEIIRLSKTKYIQVKGISFTPGNSAAITTAIEILATYVQKTVIVFAATPDDIVQVLTQAKDAKLLRGDYAWIFSESFATVTQTFSTEFNGVVFVKPSNGFWQKDNFLTQIRIARGLPARAADAFANYAFDAVLTYAYAIYQLKKHNLSPEDGDSLAAALRGVDFLGASGRVKLGGTRNRISTDYVFYNIMNSTNSKLGYWNIETGFTFQVPAVWFPGGIEVLLENLSQENTLSGAEKWFPIPLHSYQPAPRHSYSVNIEPYENSMIIFGGAADLGTIYNDIWSYSFKNKLWKLLFAYNTQPSKRKGHLSFIHNSNIYICFGHDNNAYYNDMWKFDLQNQLWQQITFGPSDYIPEPRERSAGVMVGDRFYIFGGAGPISNLGDINYYDTVQNVWVEVQPAEDSDKILGRDYHCLVHHNGHLIAFGGRTPGSIQGSNDLYVFSLATNKWTIINQISRPHPRQGMMCSVYNDKMYLVSGWMDSVDKSYGESYDSPSFRDLHELDLNYTTSTMTWRKIYEQMPGDYKSRDTAVAAQFESKMIIFGGWGAEEMLNDLYRIDLDVLEIEKVHGQTKSTTGLAYHSANLMGSNALIFGGITNANVPQNILYKFSLDTYLWETVQSEGKLPPARMHHATAAIGDLLYVFAGRSEGTLFEDLWEYSFNTNTWREIVPTGEKPIARYGHTMSIVFFKSEPKIVVYGGHGISKPLDELWIFDINKEQWNRQTIIDNSVSPYPKVIHIRSTESKGDLLVYGGQDAAENPDNGVYKLSFSNMTWSRIAESTFEFTGSLSTFLSLDNDNFITFGGDRYGSLSQQLMVFSSQSSEVLDVSASYNLPESRAAHVAVLYGDSVVIQGGIGAMKNTIQTRSDSVIHLDIWKLSLRASPNSTMFNGTDIHVSCSPGTEYQNGVCLPCSSGSYNEVAGARCKKCPKGFHSSMKGAQSFRFCIPCPLGTYSSQEGMSACKACTNPNACPIGSASDVSNSTETLTNTTLTRQPVPYKEADQTVQFASFIAVGATAVLVIILLSILALFSKKCRKFYYRVDFFFMDKHNYGPGVTQRKKTLVGGVFTLMYYLIIPVSIFLIVFPFAYNNLKETRSLIPNLSLLNQKIYTDILAEVTVVGYTGTCIDPAACDNYDPVSKTCQGRPRMQCHPDILPTVTGVSTTNNMTVYCSVPEPHQCQVILTCTECSIVQDQAKLGVQFNEDNSWATGYIYSITTNSGYPGQLSVIAGSISTSDRALIFRGLKTPTIIQLNGVQTTYSDESQKSRTGLHLDYLGVSLGSQVEYKTFQHKNGFEIRFEISKDSISLEVQRYSKESVVTLLTKILGSVSGLISGMVFFLRIVEKYLNCFTRVMKFQPIDDQNAATIWETYKETKNLNKLRSKLDAAEKLEGKVRQAMKEEAKKGVIPPYLRWITTTFQDPDKKAAKPVVEKKPPVEGQQTTNAQNSTFASDITESPVSPLPSSF